MPATASPIEPWTTFLTHRHDTCVPGRERHRHHRIGVCRLCRPKRMVPQWRWELADKTVYAKRIAVRAV